MRLPPFQRLVDDHRHDVWRACVAVAGMRHAEDVYQETFLAALRAYPRLRDGRNLRGWLLAIAHNKAIDAHRAAAKRSDAPLRDEAVAPAEGDPELWAAVGQLPPKQRAAVAYRYVSDLTYKDVAALIGCSEAAARQNAREGVRKLKEVLG